MKDTEHAEVMLQLAKRELKALGGMLDEEVFEDSIFGFHAQQAIEKRFKAWPSSAGIAYPKTHDLDDLVALLMDNQEDVPDRFAELCDLTDFAVQFRYDVHGYFDPETDRENILKEIADLVTFVEGSIQKKK